VTYGDAIEFNTWLTQPGNHRLVLRIKERLCLFLKRDVEIRSWPDVYGLFEEAFNKNTKSKALFQPFFSVQPPSPKTGASTRQIQLYRGAFVDPEVLKQGDTQGVKQVTYRGHKLEVAKQPEIEPASASQVPAKAAPRFYRGVRVQ